VLCLSAGSILLPPPAEAGSAPQAGTILFANRCAGGCTFSAGPDDSIANISSVVLGQVTLSEFAAGTEVWEEVRACLQRSFQPFDVVVTDVDPGAVVHSEIVIAGSPEQAGLPAGTAGVAPKICGFLQVPLLSPSPTSMPTTPRACAGSQLSRRLRASA
jgi:hypothetical protein